MANLLLFCISVGVFAAIFAVLDIISDTDEPCEALRTLEVRLLFIINVVLAALIAFFVLGHMNVKMTIISWFSIVLGYPTLIHTKIFTLKGETPDKNVSVGFELVYQKLNSLIKPGITKSIEEKGAKLLKKFMSLSLNQLVESSKNYTTPKKIDDKKKQMIIDWLDKIKTDMAGKDEEMQNRAKRSIYIKVLDIGGFRGIKYILKNCEEL